MLCVNNYTQKYIDECRSSVAEQVSAYQALVAAAKNQTTADASPLNTAIEVFEPLFFNHMVLALDNYFVHRARALDKTIKYDPAKSVLKYRVGDKIKLNVANFMLLSSAFLDEIESKYL